MRTWQRSFFQAFTRVRILRLQPATALRLINLRRIISILRFIVAKLETQRLGRLFCFAGNLWPVLSTFHPFRGLTLTFMTEVQFLGRRKFVFFSFFLFTHDLLLLLEVAVRFAIGNLCFCTP